MSTVINTSATSVVANSMEKALQRSPTETSMLANFVMEKPMDKEP